jgi:PAS domain-containing protein
LRPKNATGNLGEPSNGNKGIFVAPPFDPSSLSSFLSSGEAPDSAEASNENIAETARLQELQRYKVLDTAPELAFDRITKLAARLFEVPVALITFIDRDRQWFKSCHGMEAGQTERETSFCAHTIEDSEVMVVPDARLDPRFAQNPYVTGEPHLRFYAGAPLRTSQGMALGSLCINDTHPREFSDQQRATLADLAAMVVDELELRLAAQTLKREAAERREAEATLRESQRFLSLALEEGQMGLWSVAFPEGRISWSSQMERLHGLEEGTLTARWKCFRLWCIPKTGPRCRKFRRV